MRRMVLLCAVVAAAACSGGGSGGTGPSREDLVGVWHLAEVRYLDPEGAAGPASVVLSWEEEVEFSADGSFRAVVTIEGVGTHEVQGAFRLTQDSLISTPDDGTPPARARLLLNGDEMRLRRGAIWDFDDDGVSEAAIEEALFVRDGRP